MPEAGSPSLLTMALKSTSARRAARLLDTKVSSIPWSNCSAAFTSVLIELSRSLDWFGLEESFAKEKTQCLNLMRSL